MPARHLCLVLGLLLGSVVNASFAESRVIAMVDHPGASPEQIERVYTEAYEQSGFRLADRRKKSGYGGSWAITLTFELTDAPYADDGIPGTTLMITSGEMPSPCAPCQLARQGYIAPSGYDPDPVKRTRGLAALAAADAAALTKVRRHLGASLAPIPPAH